MVLGTKSSFGDLAFADDTAFSCRDKLVEGQMDTFMYSVSWIGETIVKHVSSF